MVFYEHTHPRHCLQRQPVPAYQMQAGNQSQRLSSEGSHEGHSLEKFPSLASEN